MPPGMVPCPPASRRPPGELRQGELPQGELLQGQDVELWHGELRQGELLQGELQQGELRQGELRQGTSDGGGGGGGGGEGDHALPSYVASMEDADLCSFVDPRWSSVRSILILDAPQRPLVFDLTEDAPQRPLYREAPFFRERPHVPEGAGEDAGESQTREPGDAPQRPSTEKHLSEMRRTCQKTLERTRLSHRLVSKQARDTALAEGLTLAKAQNMVGYANVVYSPHSTLGPFMAHLRDTQGSTEILGRFTTPEEAALCFARTPQGRARAQAQQPRPAAPSVTREQALQCASDEGLTLHMTEHPNDAPTYTGVSSLGSFYRADYYLRSKKVCVGCKFQTAEEAALCRARELAQSEPQSPPPKRTRQEQWQKDMRDRHLMGQAQIYYILYGMHPHTHAPTPTLHTHTHTHTPCTHTHAHRHARTTPHIHAVTHRRRTPDSRARSSSRITGSWGRRCPHTGPCETCCILSSVGL